MITQKEIKYYSSLLQKKYRQREKKFIAEGDKLITEGIESGFIPEIILTTTPFFEEQDDYFNSLKNFRIEKIRTAELKKLTDTKSPQQIAAIFPFVNKNFSIEQIRGKMLVYLDNISDPGNTGTILRNCDWFGISDIMMSEVNHPIWDAPEDFCGGSGRVATEYVAYCPKCEEKPSPNGSPIQC